jgi:hypothetical protein
MLTTMCCVPCQRRDIVRPTNCVSKNQFVARRCNGYWPIRCAHRHGLRHPRSWAWVLGVVWVTQSRRESPLDAVGTQRGGMFASDRIERARRSEKSADCCLTAGLRCSLAAASGRAARLRALTAAGREWWLVADFVSSKFEPAADS